MFEYTEAGPKIHDAMYHCHADIMKHQPPISQPHTKRPYGEKVSELDANIMRYIHCKDWEPRLEIH